MGPTVGMIAIRPCRSIHWNATYGPSYLDRLSRDRVAHHDRRTVNCHGQPCSKAGAHLDLRQVLRLLVCVVEGLTALEVRLEESSRVAPADIARADVVQALQPGTPAAEVEHGARAVHVDSHAQVPADAEIVDGREVEDLRHAGGEGCGSEAEPWERDVALHQLDARGSRGIDRPDRCDRLPRGRRTARLHEAHRPSALAPAQELRQQRGCQEAGNPGHEQGRHRTPVPVSVVCPSALACEGAHRSTDDRSRASHPAATIARTTRRAATAGRGSIAAPGAPTSTRATTAPA